MKTIISLAIATFFCIASCAQQPQNRLAIDIDEQFAQQDQWIYLIAKEGNQAWFVDSLFLPKGTMHFEFKNINRDNPYNNRVYNESPALEVRSNTGKRYGYLYELDETFDVHIRKDKDGIEHPSGVGAKSDINSYNEIMKLRSFDLHSKDTLERLRRAQIPAERLAVIKDSLNKVLKNMETQRFVRELDSDNGNDAYMAYDILKSYKGFTEEELAPYMAKMKERFPNHQAIQAHPKSLSYPPATEGTKAVIARILAMIKGNKGLPKVEPYKIGDTINELAVADSTGKLISIKDIKTPYILIDFWASWCSPCRQESPYLKEAQAKYKDSLTIYAISLDQNRDKWLTAIKEDQTEMFTHLFLPGLAEKAEAVTDKFGISAIPANFLLDADRKIIAENLRENALSEKLLELTK